MEDERYVEDGGFNTASGKHCCNSDAEEYMKGGDNDCFNTASGKHCCNQIKRFYVIKLLFCFNTASGKHCCNGIKPGYKKLEAKSGFQYRKR